jgi:hypothetical protein
MTASFLSLGSVVGDYLKLGMMLSCFAGRSVSLEMS